MKRCPKCNRNYEDDTLRFCLEDGSPLSVVARDAEPPATEILPRVQPTLKSSAGPTIPSYPNAGEFRPRESVTRQSNPILTAGVIAIVVLLVALVGIAAFFVLRQTSGDESAQANRAGDANRGSSPTVREGAPSSSTKSTPETSATT